MHRAADALSAAGKRVSVRAVRERIGRGSTTTIAEELRNWHRVTQSKKTDSATELGDLRLPPGLAQEAELLYLRVLAQAGLHFSRSAAAGATVDAAAAQRQLALLAQLDRVSEFGAGVSRELTASIEERARLTAELADRDSTISTLQASLAAALERVTRLTEELSAIKLAAAEREALAFTRVEGLSKHLMRMTEEQRSQLSAPLAALREKHDALQTREAVMTQQLSALREANGRLVLLLQQHGIPPPS